ncbi:MAG TPA: CBS domain-containing protein [Candidatus Binatia bacterium]|nr:CBS domain-containing protein [Candidatus Binatia bacterium]
MEVAMWMTRDPVTVEPETRVSQAARVMAMRRVRRLPVTAAGSAGRSLVGIVSTHDVWRACPADMNPLTVMAWPSAADVPVASIMARRLVTVTPDTPVETAARLLRRARIGALPVVAAGRLAGIITESDLLDVLLEVTGSEEPGIRISFDADPDEDVIAELLEIGRKHGVRLASVLSARSHDVDGESGGVVAVARLVGHETPGLIEDVWASGHRVRRVQRGTADASIAGSGPAKRAPTAR